MKTASRVFLTAIMAVFALAAISFGAHASPVDHVGLALGAFDPQTASLMGLGAAGTIEQLRKLAGQRTATVDAMNLISTAAAARPDGNLTAEERTVFDTHTAKIAEIDGDIKRVRAGMDAQRSVDLGAGAVITGTVDNTRDATTHGFRNFAEFATSVMNAGINLGGAVDPRLQIGAASTAPTNMGNESSGTDGGYLVPPEFSSTIMQTAYNQNDSFLPMTDNTPITGNTMAFPVDETTPWGASGIKAYWDSEAGAAQDSKAKFDPAMLRLKKLTALVPITEEMMRDGTALGSYIQRKTPEAINFKTNEALWEGSGAGKPKGYFTATGLRVTQTKESGQAADTVVALNVSKMRARMSAASWRRAIWQINNDVLPQLDALAYATTATNTPIYKPEGGKYGYGTLLGKDVMVTDFNATVGDLGDIALVDWGMYRSITAAGGIETASSMHFWFDRGITAFRSVFRIDGQPGIVNPVTPNKGSNTLSPIVILEAR